MPPPRSSRRLYKKYRDDVAARLAGRTSDNGHPHHEAFENPSEKPKPKKPRSRSAVKLFLEFWNLLGEHRRTLLIALATLAVSTLVGLVPLYGTKLVFDNVLGDKPLPHFIPHWLYLPQDPRALLSWICIVMVALTILATLIGNSSRWQATRITKRVSVAARKKLFDHAVRLPLHRVYDLKSGGLASILREDAGGIGELVFSMLYNPWRAIVQLLGSLLVLALVDWRLLLGSLVLLPTVWLTHRTWIGRIRPIFRDIRITRQSVDAHATESFGGMRIVRAFSRQRTEATQFTRQNHLMARQEIYAWWWSRGIEITWAVLIPLATAVILWYGGSRVLTDADKVKAGLLAPGKGLTTGDVVMFLTYLASLLGPIATLASSATALQNNLAGLDRTLDLLAEDPEMPNRPGAATVSKDSARGRITLNNVSFAYPGKRSAVPALSAVEGSDQRSAQTTNNKPQTTNNIPVLHNITLDVQPGETIALVGPSGAGKTTLCNLIARFYDPTTGSISLDGADLRDIDLDSYRRLLGIVEQDTFLFDGTIADNIAYGRRSVHVAQPPPAVSCSQDIPQPRAAVPHIPPEIIEAAKQANAHDFITQLESGYDTLIGERGVKLSGGQRQRLTIARAILADPKILILDEATSNLDTESERLIQQSLHALMQNRTTFVIAHRLSTITHAHRILVLESGRIIEQGTHEELMARSGGSGRYRQMVELQTRPASVPVPRGTPATAMTG